MYIPSFQRLDKLEVRECALSNPGCLSTYEGDISAEKVNLLTEIQAVRIFLEDGEIEIHICESCLQEKIDNMKWAEKV